MKIIKSFSKWCNRQYEYETDIYSNFVFLMGVIVTIPIAFSLAWLIVTVVDYLKLIL